MLYVIFAYFMTVFVVIFALNVRKTRYQPYPSLKLRRDGISFYSKSTHRIKAENTKVMQVENRVYLRQNKKMITLLNVDKVKVDEGYIYFKALGRVKILFSCKSIYRYFNLDIESDKIDIRDKRQQALQDMIDHLFDVNQSMILKRYIRFVREVMNIDFKNGKLTIKQNKFMIPYTLKYKLNNVIKQVKVNQTLCKK
ncbi:MAG: hypothetical protein E7351_00775 [Clostridiales bacterium]|nr:hypothetical protein [Clostridiales bacterium]